MIVISKVSNKRLIKGHRYEVQSLFNNGSNQRWIEGKIKLVGSGRFSVDNFTDAAGSPIAKINYQSPLKEVDRFVKFEDCKEGDILVCLSDNYKTMARGSMYKIEKLEKKEISRGGGGGGGSNFGYSGLRTYHDHNIKFVGLKRKLKFNQWNFRKLTAEELREVSLGQILSNEEPNIVKSSDIRKIDLIENKEKMLMAIISRTILDVNRHHLSIVDWSCQKTGEKYRIKPEDFNKILDMKLSEILEILEK
jgi:hypothetical protein